MTILRFRTANIALVGALLTVNLLVSACGNVIPGAASEPPRLFDLSPKSTFAADLPKVSWQLIVEVPVAAASLNTNRIALRRDEWTLEYFERATWTDVAPRLVQTLMVESFENTDKIVSVGREAVGLRSDYVLKTELREFQAEYQSGRPVVHVRIIAKLVKMPQRTIIDWTSEDHVIPATSDTMEAIVEAFDEALGSTLKRIVEWTLRAAPKNG